MATKTQRAKNQSFPYSTSKRDAIHALFKVGNRVHATVKKRGQDQFVRGKVTRVARTGWLYVKLDGRKSPTKVDPTKWSVGEGHAPAAAEKAAPKKKQAPKKKVAPKPKTAPKPAPKKRPAATTPRVRAKKAAAKVAEPVAIAGGSVEASGVAQTATAPKHKRVRNRKKKKADPAPVAEMPADEAPAPPKRTPVHVEEPAPAAAGEEELN